MGKVRKRGKSWQIDYLDPTGKRIRKTFEKKKEAEAELAKRVALIAEGRYLDVKKEYTTTMGELLEKYEENHQHQPGFQKSKRYFIKNFRAYFGEETRLSQIRYVDLETFRNHLRQTRTRRGTLKADSTVNREIACLHHVFAKAVEWEMIEKSPLDRGKTLIMKENNQRVRYLTEDEITHLLAACEEKPHLHRIVVCALHTGMRKGEILSLKWGQIRNGFIYLEETKTKERRVIPVNETLSRALKEIRKEQGLTSKYVFTYAGRSFSRVDRAFHGALTRAKIEDFRFHDLRHTFASHVLMKGGSLKDVQELLGHKSMTMTLRYAHLSQEHKRNAVNLLNSLTGGRKSVSMSQNVTKRKKHKNVVL